MNIVPDPIIAGTILGKYNRAKELKVDFLIDPDSSMRDIPDTVRRENLVKILGNILDNGFEAVLCRPPAQRTVKLSMIDLGNDLIFDIDDSGKGVPPELWNTIFENGFTTKTEGGHGMGLFLVKKTINQMGGTISIGNLLWALHTPSPKQKKWCEYWNLTWFYSIFFFPDGSGIDLPWKIRTNMKKTDVVLITAAKEVAFFKEALRGGVFDYILKPLAFN